MNTSFQRNRIAWLVLCVMGAFALTLPTNAASFDCAKAGTKVEKLICGDAELSKLDEELNAAYKSALQNQSQADIVKQAQKQWMKERNGCADAGCVKRAYEVRLHGLSLLTATHTSSDIGSAAQQGADKPRFRFCRDTDYNTCEQPGRGYTMCERFLKLLNSLPSDEPPPVCDIKLPPGFEEFQLAKWEPMPVAENMRLIYDMEMYLVAPSKSDYYQTKWPQYYAVKFTGCAVSPGIGVAACNRVPYDIWLADYQERMRKGEVEPRISRTGAVLNERGQVNLIRYERIPGGDAAKCQDNLAKFGGATGSDGHFFILTGNQKLPVKAIEGSPGSNMSAKLLLYQGRVAFVFSDGSSTHWVYLLNVAMPPLPPQLGEDEYVVTTRCDFRLNK